MKEGLSIDAAFKGTQDNTREDGLLGRLSQALADANIAGGYTRLQEPTPLRDGLYIVHEDSVQRSNFYITCKPGDYEIKSCDLTNVQFDSQGYQTSHKTPMEPAQIEAVVGKTSDYNTFIGAIGFILAHHYPSAVQNGSLQIVMDKFVRPDGAQPAASPHGRQHEEKLLSRGEHIGNIPGSIDL